MRTRQGPTRQSDDHALWLPAGRDHPERANTRRRFASPFLRSIVPLLLLGLPISAQSPAPPVILQQGQSNSRFPQQQSAISPNPTMDEKRISALNRMRQKSIVDDTARLLILARQLNAESANFSGAERMHKAAEIEKLAKSVKQKMSYAVGGSTVSPSYFDVTP